MARGVRTAATVATPYPRLVGASRPTLSASAPGTFKTGQTVTCDPGQWTGWRLTFSYQWKRDGANIAGQTAATYLLVIADETHKISCVVTATPQDPNYIARSVETAQSPTITP